MKSALPKVLQPLAGQPLLAHVIQAARRLSPAAIHVVYGHGGDARARGTRARAGRAGSSRRSSSAPVTRCCRRCRRFADDQIVLVLYGDVPLIRAQTLAELLALAGAQVPGVC